METNLNIKQVIHPGYLLNDSEIKLIEEYYGINEKEAKSPEYIIFKDVKKPLSKIYLSAITVIFAAITIPFIFTTGEAKTVPESEPAKSEITIPETENKYEEVSQNLNRLAGVVSYLVENIQTNSLQSIPPQEEPKDADPIVQEVRTAIVIKDKTPLRSEGSLKSKVLVLIGKDAKLNVKAEESDWILVSSPKGGEAWVQKEHVSMQ